MEFIETQLELSQNVLKMAMEYYVTKLRPEAQITFNKQPKNTFEEMKEAVFLAVINDIVSEFTPEIRQKIKEMADKTERNQALGLEET